MDLMQKPKYVGNHKVIKTNDGMAIQQDDKIHSLNSTASEIYELCNGDCFIMDIIWKMELKYPEYEEIETLVCKFVNQLQDAGLIEFE